MTLGIFFHFENKLSSDQNATWPFFSTITRYVKINLGILFYTYFPGFCFQESLMGVIFMQCSDTDCTCLNIWNSTSLFH